MAKLIILVGLLSAGATVVALAQSPSIAYTPQQIIAARQASYEMSVMSFASMKQAMKDGGLAKKQGFAAEGLAKWAKVLPTLFPVGTGKGETAMETQARPEIWSDRAGFEKAAANYIAATEKLSALAQANDTPAFTTQLGEVKHACDSCHDSYKER